MKRRGFLGMFGAGAVAGPVFAKNAIHGANVGMLGQGIGGAFDEVDPPTWEPINSCKTVGGEDWKAREVLNLRKIITGVLSAEEKDSIRLGRVYAQERELSQTVMSLVSVSPVRKMAMYSDRYSKHQERTYIEEAKRRLHRLLRDQT